MQTGDGYLLGLHRLSRKKDEAIEHPLDAGGIGAKPIVYLHHGLLMNSEVWVSLTDEQRCLPFALVERGYDVWVNTSSLTLIVLDIDGLSLEIIEEINTPRNPPVCPLQRMTFGIFPLISSRFMIFRTPLIIYC